MMLTSHRLHLIPASPAMLEAELAGHQPLSHLLGRPIDPAYPPEFYDQTAARFTLFRLQAHPEETGWWSWYIAIAPAGPVIGICGFKGLPTTAGQVEIGYSIVAPHQHHGYATEAARTLIAHALAMPDIRTIIAHTMPTLPASIRVLEKCGFHFDGHGDEPNVIRYRLTHTGQPTDSVVP